MGAGTQTGNGSRPDRPGGRADRKGPSCLRPLWLLPLLGSVLGPMLGLAACSRPTGDFDRARPSILHDKVMMATGELAARYRGDPVSKFNYTDDESLLRDRGWGLIRPPWTKDWIGGTIAELARTRNIPEAEGRVPPDLYYIFLSSDKFRSSNARYDRLAADAKGDAELIRPFCEVAVRVRAADDERLRALATRQVVTKETYDGAKARVYENRVMTAWVAQAVGYRIQAYQRALDGLEIETPTGNRMFQTNRAVRTLEGEARILPEGCALPSDAASGEAEARRSRIFTGWGLERPAPVK